MKKLLFIVILFLSCYSAYSQVSDKLYFCEEYTNGHEVGVTDRFLIGSHGGLITVMLYTRKPVNVVLIYLKVEKVWTDSLELLSNEPYDVQSQWYYIYLDGVRLPEDGEYKVTAIKPDGSEIASNYVTAIYK